MLVREREKGNKGAERAGMEGLMGGRGSGGLE